MATIAFSDAHDLDVETSATLWSRSATFRVAILAMAAAHVHERPAHAR
jgi:hypothetical protein